MIQMAWKPKLTFAQEEEIIQFWENPTQLDRPTYRELGEEYGISAGSVAHIVWRKNKINPETISKPRDNQTHSRKVWKFQWSDIVRCIDEGALISEIAEKFEAKVSLIRRIYFEWNYVKYRGESPVDRKLAWLRVSEKLNLAR